MTWRQRCTFFIGFESGAPLRGGRAGRANNGGKKRPSPQPSPRGEREHGSDEDAAVLKSGVWTSLLSAHASADGGTYADALPLPSRERVGGEGPCLSTGGAGPSQAARHFNLFELCRM